jgi:sugar lactone lactonase YvrE
MGFMKVGIIMDQVEHLLSLQNEVGESPIWIPEEKVLTWIDIEADSVFQYRPDNEKLDIFKVDVSVTSLGRRGDTGWITAAKTGLYYWDGQSGSLDFIVDPEADTPGLRFNDGVVDRQGRFLIGTMNENDLNAPDGSLYRLNVDGKIEKLESGYAVPNGMGLSPDGRTLYVTDMFHSQILAYDYDAAEGGGVTNKRVLVTVPQEAGWPDGLIVDSEGFVWSAHWAGGKISRYDPDGTLEREISLPVANVTCMAFGGDALDELYITTAWFTLSEEDRKKQPWAGDLFRLKTDIQGLAEPVFGG